MKKEILKALEDAKDNKIKKKALITILSEADADFDNDEFEKCLISLVKKSKVTADDKYITLTVETTGSEKRKRHEVDTEIKMQSEDEEREVPPTITAKPDKVKEKGGKKDTFELWKNGEQAWRENSLEFDYLADNPDKITRLFCGNLNKNITEEQLKEHLPGITYIKWIRDKETGDFYGTTFLEMADAKSAASAVLKDRTKYLGR